MLSYVRIEPGWINENLARKNNYRFLFFSYSSSSAAAFLGSICSWECSWKLLFLVFLKTQFCFYCRNVVPLFLVPRNCCSYKLLFLGTTFCSLELFYSWKYTSANNSSSFTPSWVPLAWALAGVQQLWHPRCGTARPPGGEK